MKKPFDEVFEDKTKYGTKIKTDEYHTNGKYLIIDQGQEQIAGFTDIEEGVFTDVPAIIFGDHTRTIKYVDEPFFLGADGVKVLKSKFKDANYKYLYYALRNSKIPNTGYNRHFKWMKEVKIEYPDSAKQEEIVIILDKVTRLISLRQKELQLLDDLIKARFVEMFGDPVDNPLGWKKKQLQEIVTDDCTISYGIVQTGDDQKEGVPVFRPVDIVNRIPKLEELKKTTKEISDKYKRTILKGREMLITVRANIGDTCIVGEEFKGCNVGRGIVPIRTREDVIILDFLKHLIDSRHLNDEIKSKAKGITLIQLNMEDLREVELILPPIEKQKSFVAFAKQVDKSKFIHSIIITRGGVYNGNKFHIP
jgi:type I restriction enzyme S subunit